MNLEEKELAEAVGKLREAIVDKGPEPAWHRRIMRRHRREWPTLWSAIDELLELIEEV